jgi:5-methylcytosine-specific restriction endonuclease McrA
MENKTCTKCGEQKSISLFYKNMASDDLLTARCKACSDKISKEYRQTEKFKSLNSDKYFKEKEKSGSYHYQEKIKVCSRCKRIKNVGSFGRSYKTSQGVQRFKYICISCEAEKRKQKWSSEAKSRKATFKGKTNHRIGRAIWQTLKKNGISKNGHSWEKIVGYTAEDLIERLKSTIPNGHVWADYLKPGLLHIDHIRPLSSFNFQYINDPEIKKAWALENLQLLTAKENLRKGSKWESI